MRSSLVATVLHTDATLAQYMNVRDTYRILHARGDAILAGHLSRDLDLHDAPGLSQALRRFVAAETEPRLLSSDLTLLHDDADDVLSTALWLKQTARAEAASFGSMCRIVAMAPPESPTIPGSLVLSARLPQRLIYERC
jgi:hypothetical protein